MSNKVYVIQDSPGKNMTTAQEHGELVILLNSNESISTAENKIERYLTNFQPEDRLLLIGNPLFIAMCVITAWSQLASDEPLQVLVWDRLHEKYSEEKIYA